MDELEEGTKVIWVRMPGDVSDEFRKACRAEGLSAPAKLRQLAYQWLTDKQQNKNL